MFGYILLIVFCLAFWTLFAIGEKEDVEWIAGFGLVLGFINVILLIAASINLGLRSSEADDFAKEVAYRQELVNSINGEMSPFTVTKIIESAKFVNDRIERNQKHCNSKMWGFMYNKEIAEVEPIDIPKLKYQITIEE